MALVETRPGAPKWSACDGKTRYATEPSAQAQARRSLREQVGRRGRGGAQAINWYRCRFCGWWHLTRQGGR